MALSVLGKFQQAQGMDDAWASSQNGGYDLPKTLFTYLETSIVLSRERFHKTLCLAFLGLIPFSSVIASENGRVVLSVDAQKMGLAVNPWVTAGFNFGNWMNMAEYGKTMHKNVPPATLRFPGGNVGDDQDMIPPVMDLFATNLRLLKANVPVIIQTRVFQGRVDLVPKNRPEDAAEAAKLARERKLNVAYWQVGNEPDLYAVTRGDPSWTAEHYCEVFRAQALAIKAVEPNAKFAGPGVSGAVPDAANFLNRFVKGCGDVVDLLTWHIYPTSGTGSDAEAIAKISEPEYWLAQHRKTWADPESNPLGYTRKIKFGMTEYGLSWKTDNAIYLADMPAAMFAAETALRMSRAGLDAAYYFAYQGVGFHGLLDQTGVPRPTFYGFRMINNLKGRFVEAKTSDDGIWVSAVRNGKKLTLILMNTWKEARSVPTDLAGWKFVRGEYFDADIVENEAPVSKFKPASELMLPAQSMTRLEFVAR